HFALLEAALGAPGGGPAGGGPMGPAVGIAPGGTPGGTGGMAAVGGSAAAIAWVASGWKSGCCSGGYHLPSDACHQPSPCPVRLTTGDLRQNRLRARALAFALAAVPHDLDCHRYERPTDDE